MPRVNVEQQAFTDPRFAHLGKLLKTSRYDALGRMALVWSEATERNAYVLAEDLLNHLFEDAPGFANLIVKAKLGRRTSRGIHICGTRGRIEWLANKRRACRENGKRGGRPRKPNEEPMENQRRFGAKTTLALASAPALVPEEEPFPSPAEGRDGRGTDGSGNSNGNIRPLWTERMYRYKADKIAEWIDRLTDHNHRPLRPGDEDFDVKFEAKWQMRYDYWIEQREAHEAYYLACRGAG